MEFNLNEWLDYAGTVAKSFAKKFYGIDSEDIYQELAIALITKQEKLAAAAQTPSYVKKCLQNVAWNYCMSERAVKVFYSDQYDYTADSVKQLLEEILGGSVEAITVPEEMKTVRGDDNLAIYGDISRALSELPQNYRNIIEAKYISGDEPANATERKTFSRAVNRLVSDLNFKKKTETKEHEGPGSRKALSNAAALYNTKAVAA